MYRLVIGNKNYSSWSLRAWLLMTAADLPFDEVPLPLSTPTFAERIGRYSPTGRVPVLLVDSADNDDGAPLAIWDTLAIAEYLAEAHPDRGLWPASRSARARARSICAEMHAGFGHLRSAMPMNISATLPGLGWSIGVQDDIDRLVTMWRECLAAHGGPLLFGRFTIADAFFAPVLSRFRTYSVALPDDIARYRDEVLALPAMRAWTAAALEEDAFVVDDEPYRRGR
jgi:glutathione S-transferase